MASTPKTRWQRLYGHKRPRSRWRRYRDKRAYRDARRERYECAFCGRRQTFTTYEQRAAHEYQAHRGPWLRRELLQIERDAKWQTFAVDDCRAWAGHTLARRYRRLMRAWWALGKAEYSAAMDWHPPEGLPRSLPLTRLGWPSDDPLGLQAYITRERKRLKLQAS